MKFESRITAKLVLFILLLSTVSTLANRSSSQPISRTIYIRENGRVFPPDAPIKWEGGVYYLTGDIEAIGGDGVVIEADNVVIDGRGHRVKGDMTSHAAGVLIQGRLNIVIKNLKVESFHYGIRMLNSQEVSVVNSTIIGCTEGVSAASSSRMKIYGGVMIRNVAGVNVFHSESLDVIYTEIRDGIWGAYLSHSPGSRVVSNTITNASWAVILLSSPKVTLIGNEFIGCGIYLSDSEGNIVANNTVNGKPLIYMENSTDFTVKEAGQIVLLRCRRVNITGLNISKTSVGIILWKTNETVVDSSRITGNNWGILLYKSSNNTVTKSIVKGNAVGVYLYESTGNRISWNIHYRNDLGLWLACSSSNFVYGNCFVMNRQQANAGCGENEWEYVKQGGNYWSDWIDTDADEDGFIDEPYRVGWGNIDEKPITVCPLAHLLDLPPVACTLRPLLNGTKATVGEYFLVKVEVVSPQLVKAVRFATPGFSTGWFRWVKSEDIWNASEKTVKLMPFSLGEFKIEAEVKDVAGRLTHCTTIVEVEGQAPETDNRTHVTEIIVIVAVTGPAAALLIFKKKLQRFRRRKIP
ncbi:MAG: NosD domain-containing protein [Thermofilaceae archaeon]|nr:NosD domain-containing protein [Thermofilaceae archaeon]